MHTNIHSYMHNCILTYIHTFIHTCIGYSYRITLISKEETITPEQI